MQQRQLQWQEHAVTGGGVCSNLQHGAVRDMFGVRSWWMTSSFGGVPLCQVVMYESKAFKAKSSSRVALALFSFRSAQHT